MDIIGALKKSRTGKMKPVVAAGYGLLVTTQLGIERLGDALFAKPRISPALG